MSVYLTVVCVPCYTLRYEPPSWDQYLIWLTEWCHWIIAGSHQQLVSDIWHKAGQWPYSHISVLKAITARSPCRKIPNESIKAPFSHPLVSAPGVGLADTDVLVKDTAGSPATPGPAKATSPSWDSMLTPLTAAMGQKSWTRLTDTAESSSFSHTHTHTQCVLPSPPPAVGQLIDVLGWTVFGERWWHPLPSRRTLILLLHTSTQQSWLFLS